MKILDVRWFKGCGIVRVEDDRGSIKYYISDLRPGNTAEEDQEQIMQWGARFPIDAGDVLFGVK
jgi:hypothetical protein